MRRWALLVVVLYVLLLATLALPLMAAAFADSLGEVMKEAREQVFGGGEISPSLLIGCWIWIGVMALAEVGLLVVPVRIAGRRPVSRRWIIWPILAGLVLAGVMIIAMYLAVQETLENTQGAPWWLWVSAFCTVGGVWLVWAFLFGFYSGNRPPRTFMARLVRFLLAGSILELLVAVPTHVLARVRGYCCAGFGTFWGLAAGLSVMLAAFGPGVFFLFVRRYSSLKPPVRREEQTTTTPNGKPSQSPQSHGLQAACGPQDQV